MTCRHVHCSARFSGVSVVVVCPLYVVCNMFKCVRSYSVPHSHIVSRLNKFGPFASYNFFGDTHPCECECPPTVPQPADRSPVRSLHGTGLTTRRAGEIRSAMQIHLANRILLRLSIQSFPFDALSIFSHNGQNRSSQSSIHAFLPWQHACCRG